MCDMLFSSSIILLLFRQNFENLLQIPLVFKILVGGGGVPGVKCSDVLSRLRVRYKNSRFWVWGFCYCGGLNVKDTIGSLWGGELGLHIPNKMQKRRF